MLEKRRKAALLMATSVVRSPSEVRAAERAFKKLDRGTQFRLCYEIAETRGAELVLAYHNLMSVGFGYKTRKGRGKTVENVEFRHPCVVFIVSRKWRSKNCSSLPQRLPAHLFTYTDLGDERILCAVPTDVKKLSTYGKASRPHNDIAAMLPYGIAVESDGRREWGVVTCAIEREPQQGVAFALSCRHVFSMSLGGPEKPSGCKVHPAGGNSILGTTVDVRGRLVAEPAGSFDAQLAKVSNRAALRSALSGLRFEPTDPAARGPEDVPAGFWILTPRRNAQGKRLKVWAESRDYVSKILPYNGLDAVHHHILHAVASDPLGHGDSGSPAVLVAAGGKLLGMYIGGDGINAYIIPAWQLMRGANYERPAEKLWTVVNA